jgi:transcriptional activator of cad operon
VDVLRHSQQPLNKEQLSACTLKSPGRRYAGYQRYGDFYQIKTVDLLGQGKVDEAYNAINTGIDLRCRG